MTTAYYPSSSCSGTMIWTLAEGTLSFLNATTNPNNGKLFRVVTTNQGLYSTSPAGGAHLTTACSYSFGANSGVSTTGGRNCSDDRFDFDPVGTLEIALVKASATSLQTTDMVSNAPGDTTAGMSTTTTLTKQ